MRYLLVALLCALSYAQTEDRESSANPPLVDDNCGGIRESTCGGIFYAVMGDGNWDPNYDYRCPSGYVWMSSTEYTTRQGESATCQSESAYYNQCGWAGYEFNSIARNYFRFEDSDTSNGWSAHSGNEDNIAVTTDRVLTQFAGLVCAQVETTAPETTAPETTAPETTAPETTTTTDSPTMDPSSSPSTTTTAVDCVADNDLTRVRCTSACGTVSIIGNPEAANGGALCEPNTYDCQHGDGDRESMCTIGNKANIFHTLSKLWYPPSFYHFSHHCLFHIIVLILCKLGVFGDIKILRVLYLSL